jgi:hypothetical protein
MWWARREESREIRLKSFDRPQTEPRAQPRRTVALCLIVERVSGFIKFDQFWLATEVL